MIVVQCMWGVWCHFSREAGEVAKFRSVTELVVAVVERPVDHESSPWRGFRAGTHTVRMHSVKRLNAVSVICKATRTVQLGTVELRNVHYLTRRIILLATQSAVELTVVLTEFNCVLQVQLTPSKS